MVEKITARALPSGSHDTLVSAVNDGLDIVFWVPVPGSIEINPLMLSFVRSKMIPAIALPSGDQAASAMVLAMGPEKILFSLLPSALAMRRWYLPGSGSLARMKTKRCPSGE